jgi:hypothetical protein
MHIRVEQSGGIAGLRSTHELDTSQLPDELRDPIMHLVDRVAFFSLASDARSCLPDATCYRVRIEDGARAHEVALDDGASDTGLLELVERVTTLARART